ncbi:HD domain-containing protein [Serratia fonticola]|uniref:ATP-binding protein n=1 Tax=Serratia fonticola TaxID=47917 RepID=A0ABY9PQA4_SERFO|nr:ATP-binding protein [Serratia fonticola]WMT15380.1 ATP-binding protein [Serratia fonticola]
MKIEQRLKLLAGENDNFSLLLAQWEFDKKLLQRALSTIIRDYPHYSLHDSSHSSTIITQIEKVIGKDVEKLSATDCWLLLESCYWHDAGMLISKDDKKNLLIDEKFRLFLLDTIDSNGDLAFHARNISKNIKDEDYLSLLEASDSLTFVLADYYRRIHAERSGDYVKKPESIRIESPRTSLIPSRLFSFVAQIVACHGKGRESLFEIPRRNDGVDSSDYAHPRYVASLLRIGDLLDIDDGRFCPTMLSNIGDVPQTSIDHQNKHASISSLQIDSDSIDIEAICFDYGSYNAQRNWFSYIQSEFDFQKKSWHKIVPNNNYRALPTINRLNCNLSGYLSVDGSAPKISLDTRRVYDYLSGALIYSERFPYIRELIQNAVDATVYKVWDRMYHVENIDGLSDSDLRGKFNSLLEHERIDISFMEKERGGDTIKYIFKIRDYATGISFSDLKKIFNVGSEVTSGRKKIAYTMKDWAKPSGYFGLGLQSVFKMCSNVIIKTKSRNDKGYLISVINTGYQPDFTIKEVSDDYFDGTEISLEIKEEIIPNTVPASASDVLNKFDPVKDNILEIWPVVVRNIIVDAFLSTKVKIFLNNDLVIFPGDKGVDFYTDYESGADYQLRVDLSKSYRTKVYYKDAIIDIERLNLAELGVVGGVNIFKGNASEWVTIDRKKLRADRSDDLESLYISIIKSNRLNIINSTPDKSEGDFYYFAYHNETSEGIWRKYVVASNPLDEYLTSAKKLVVIGGQFSNVSKDDGSVSLGIKTDCISRIVNRLGYVVKMNYICGDVKDYHGGKLSYYQFEVEFCKSESTEYHVDPELIKAWIPKNTKDNWPYRYAVPCFSPDYKDISLPMELIPKWSFIVVRSWSFNYFIFLPFNGYDNISEDVKAIYEYYKKNNHTDMNYSDFESKYFEVWTKIGVM